MRIFSKPLNKEEIGLGIIYIVSMIWFITVWYNLIQIVVIALFSGLLWSLAGAGYGRSKRFLGCPALAALLAWMMTHNIWMSTCAASGAVLSMGYGTPTVEPPDRHDYDPGSFLGRLVYWNITKNELACGLIVRAIYCQLIALCFISFAFINVWKFIAFDITIVVLSLIACIRLEGTIEI